MFESPEKVFPKTMLASELQDHEQFVRGVLTIVAAQKAVAELHFLDGTVDLPCPPVRALPHIMKDGYYDDPASMARWTIEGPELRNQFTRAALLESTWSQDRFDNQQQADTEFWAGRSRELSDSPEPASEARRRYAETIKPGYRQSLVGTIGLHSAVVRWREAATSTAWRINFLSVSLVSVVKKNTSPRDCLPRGASCSPQKGESPQRHRGTEAQSGIYTVAVILPQRQTGQMRGHLIGETHAGQPLALKSSLKIKRLLDEPVRRLSPCRKNRYRSNP